MNITDKKDELARYLFHQGTNFTAYDYMGANAVEGEDLISFRIWAPNADAVYLTGDFNFWNFYEYPAKRITEKGIWEVFAKRSLFEERGYKYKYYVFGRKRGVLKSDPYAFFSETREKNASIFYDRTAPYRWTDMKWKKHRKESIRTDCKYVFPTPINIYEVHLGSFMTRGGASTNEKGAYLSYRELAHELAEYAKKMSYTHIELLPIMEHPYDGSWGYQICGYYAPSSRFGDPDDFKYFVNHLHENGIGVILDWVPAHFPKDENGLFEFDGTPLYEYQGKDRMEHRAWGTRCFDLGRPEVQSFLISNALFWFREYHIDGLRTDAVASMLYLDYDRRAGEWIPNEHGTNENTEAVCFLRKLNSAVFSSFPDVLMIAEESTAWPLVTAPADVGGLGFNFKWNMGLANDMYDYMGTDPFFRSGKHEKLTFSMMYAFSENFILPVSHDEVVHGKGSLIRKMYGNYDEKFANLRAFACHMTAHPGKKLTFMGCEFAQFREWDYENQLEWFMLGFDKHKKTQDFYADLNRFYLEHSEFWEIDCSWDGFRWISPNDRDSNIIAYERINGKNSKITVIINFSAADRKDYRLRLPCDGKYEKVFDSDLEKYGGKGTFENGGVLVSENKVLKISIASLSALYLKNLENNRETYRA